MKISDLKTAAEVRAESMKDPEYAAADYHEQHIDELDHDYSGCWCCCITCEHVNPHFDAAITALRARARRARKEED